jgi:hypothetical protein
MALVFPLEKTGADFRVVSSNRASREAGVNGTKSHVEFGDDRLAGSHTTVPLRRVHMPGDFGISLDSYIGRERHGRGYVEGETRVPRDHGRLQSMRGFEATYRNIIDYIVRITYRIWEERDVEYIAQTYADRSRVFDDYGLQFGSGKIIADTHHTTRAFSDIQLIADEIVWAGDDEVGYRSSHRTIIRGTNDGASRYGAATGRKIDVLVIANCVSLGNKIFLEHVLYNNSSMLRQLGHDLDEVSSDLSRNGPAGWPRDAVTWDALRGAGRPDVPISESDPVGTFDIDAFVRSVVDDTWNKRDFPALSRRFDPDLRFAGPTDRKSRGLPPYQQFVESVTGAFPDLQLRVDEVYWMGNDREGYLTSVRWSATGRHSSAGIYGAPTGAEVQIWGITQHRIAEGRIVAEWTLFNELDLMMQIAAAR